MGKGVEEEGRGEKGRGKVRRCRKLDVRNGEEEVDWGLRGFGVGDRWERVMGCVKD